MKFKSSIDTKQIYDLFLLIAFFVLCAIGMANHEMWRDEIEAWLIARDSNSINELFSNLTYVGHPFLWYYGLYLAAKVTHDPVVIKILHLIIITSLVYIVIYYAPFNKLQKTLFCFGYFPFYEYGVISRNYSLGILFIFIFCALYCNHGHNYITMSLALGLASQTNVYSMMIAFVLALMLYGEVIVDLYLNRNFAERNNRLIFSCIIYLFGLFGASWQVARAASGMPQELIETAVNSAIPQSGWLAQIKNHSLILDEKILNGIWRSYIPLPDMSADGIWSTNFLTDNRQFPIIEGINSAPLIALFCSLMLFCIFAAIFSYQPKVLSIYIAGNALIYIFGIIAKIPALRHSGHLFILLIVCFWIFNYGLEKSNFRLDNRQNKLVPFKIATILYRQRLFILTTILFIQFYAGVKLYALDLARPFSNIFSVAEYIKMENLKESTIVATSDLTVFPISAWLNKRIYYPETASFGTFTVSTPGSTIRKSNISEAEIVQQIRQLQQENSDRIILVTDKKLQQPNVFGLSLLNSFQQPNLLALEFFIYLVD